MSPRSWLFAALFASGCGPPQSPDCPTPTGPGTRHAGSVAAGEVWTAEAGPHYVDGTVSVPSGASLEVAACADVRLTAGATLLVHGHLHVAGEQARRVRFSRADEGAGWGSLAIGPGGTASLHHLTLAGGGGADAPAALHVVGGDTVLIDQVVVRDPEGVGVLLEGAAQFASGSSGLFVDRSSDAPLVVGS